MNGLSSCVYLHVFDSYVIYLLTDSLISLGIFFSFVRFQLCIYLCVYVGARYNHLLIHLTVKMFFVVVLYYIRFDLSYVSTECHYLNFI